MQPTCERCGRPISADPSAPGSPAQATCTCENAPAMLAAPDGPAKVAARGAEPLPSPHEGSTEVDPWSVPPPEGGYENLDIELDPTGPQQPVSAAAPSEPAEAEAAPADIASSIAARAEAEPALPRPAAGVPRAAIAAGGAAILLVAAISAWLLLRGRDSSARAGSGVRVTVTQEVPWTAPPPLAPIDPSYVERVRREPVAAPKPSPPAPAPAPRRATSTSTATAPRAGAGGGAPAAPAAPPSPPAEIAPEPAPQLVPAAASAPGADIPLPPPPVIPVVQPTAAAPAAAEPAPRAAAARAPVLQTRSCVADALRVPPALEGRLPPEVVLQVQVGEDGRAADVAFPGAIDPRLRAPLSSAVRTCRFTPGADANGQPAAARTTMRLRFDP